MKLGQLKTIEEKVAYLHGENEALKRISKRIEKELEAGNMSFLKTINVVKLLGTEADRVGMKIQSVKREQDERG